MLATKTDRVPTGTQWLHEVKWDGVRVLVDVHDGIARMTSRNDNNVTAAWPELSDPPLGDRDLLVDGEVIALNERGVPDFRVLQHRMHLRNAKEVARLVKTVPATLMVFDLLRLDGEDLSDRPLEERRALLEELPLADSKWQVPAAYDDGDMLFDATLQQGLEGVVSKRRGSRYRFDQRSDDWRKLAHRHRGSFVVGGWRPQVGTSEPVGRAARRRADRRRAALPRSRRQRHRRRHQHAPDRAARTAVQQLVALRRRGAADGCRGHVLGGTAGGGRHRHPWPRLRAAAPAVVPGRARRRVPGGPGVRRLLCGAAIVAGLLVPATATAAVAPLARADVVELGGVRVELREGTTQVVTVNHSGGVRARVSLWRLTGEVWRRQLTTADGRTGYGGLVPGDRRVQGTGATPLGTYGLPSTFGTHGADPTCRAAPPPHPPR